jgi:hypothetical protein
LSTGGTLVDGQSIYVGKGSFTTPEVGDLLIRYEAVPSGLSVTAYGTPHGSTFQRFVDGSGNELYGIYLGTPADAVEEMHSSYVSSLWFFRFTGFFLLWGGMFLIFRPLLAVFRVIPILGEIATASVAAVTFVGALTLTLITIIVSLILHSIIALIVVVLLIVGVIAFRHRLSLNGLAHFRTGRVI